jgi:secreted PhoX family phosphatase
VFEGPNGGRRRDATENFASNPSRNPTIDDVIAARFNRRDFLKGGLGTVAVAAITGSLTIAAASPSRASTPSRFKFAEVEAGVDDNHHVAEGYSAEVLIRWGDAVLPGAPPFDPFAQSARSQKLQFGYNNDFLGYLPMPGARDPSRHGLLVVNHEYTNEELMFPGLGRQDRREVAFSGMTRELVDIEMAAHGGSVVEVRRDRGRWRVVGGSKFARRIHADTLMRITGPAAGHARMRTKADPAGRTVLGMLNNCAGGITPWGTWLTCEENFNGYFWSKLADDHPEARNYRRYGVPANWYAWGKWYERFDVSKEPNEANRFGWVVEIDPFDPLSVPKKRTALGRFKHEGAAGIINKDGRYVIYSGDDQSFEYIYRFVTRDRVSLLNRRANRNLLDHGTLSVARFDADGSVDWIPLIFGQGPLTPGNGFRSQADVVIEARHAADLLGATKMDRPEDVKVNPKTNRVYAALTSNDRRTPDQVDAANPRANNRFGHIIEMAPPQGDHAAARFAWNILLSCGDPSIPDVGASFSPATTRNGWFGMPDNIAIDGQGRLWIATDGNSATTTGRTDGLWGLETEGAQRRTSRCFYRVPVGAELCGPCFTPDDETLFVAVQHPGEGATLTSPPDFSTFDKPATRWPDFKAGMPPRPAIVAITRNGGGRIAS